MGNEWSEWITHDGKGCPCVGMYVRVFIETLSGKANATREGVAYGGLQWSWENAATVTRETDTHYYMVGMIVRYQVRKPRALLDLIEAVEAMPVNDRELVTL